MCGTSGLGEEDNKRDIKKAENTSSCFLINVHTLTITAYLAGFFDDTFTQLFYILNKLNKVKFICNLNNCSYYKLKEQ